MVTKTMRQCAPEGEDRLLPVNAALDQLATEDPVKASVVKLRYLVGLSNGEVAEALGLSERYWAYSKARLFRQLSTPD